MLDLPLNIFSLPFTGDGFQLGDRMIPATIALRRDLKNQLQSGQRFNFGIHPEHVKIDNALPHVTGTIVNIEPHDNQIIVHTTVPDRIGFVEITFVCPPSDHPLEIGQAIPLKFDLKQMKLFDLGTGEQLFPNPDLLS